MSHKTHNSNVKSLWTLISVSSLLLLLGGLTLGLAQESQLVLPTAQDGWHHTSPVSPAPLYQDSRQLVLELRDENHRTEEPPELIQVAVRPEVWQSIKISPANLNVPANLSAPVRVPSASPTGAPSEINPEKQQLRISSRYQDPKMLSFLASTSMQQMASLYLEASRTIDSRHVAPTSYEDRTDAALEGLLRALQNPEFLKAAGARGSDANLQSATTSIQEMLDAQPARSAEESLGVMQFAADTLSRQLGVRQEVVALEFMNAVLDSLDKYSSFMPERVGQSPGAAMEPIHSAAHSTAGLEERIVGVGIEMKKHDNGALIMGTVEGGSAAEAGIQRGDILVRIGSQPLTGMSLNQIADLVSGPAGSTVDIQIDRAGQRYSATLERRQVYVSSVGGATMVDATHKVGYVKLKQFSESSAEDLEKAMWKLYNGGMDSLVLDLRGNPGGLLTEAVQVSDLFLPAGVIVSTKGRTASDNTTETAKRAKTWSLPLVVLVDENSASASEIFAAAIQDNGRGVVVGRNTYGKGTVQTHFPLNTAAGVLKLTTAKFYAPSGREMAGVGVAPDYAVKTANEDSAQGLTDDNDVQAAIEVCATDLPSQLAKAAGQGKKLSPRVSVPRVFEELPAPGDAVER
jgi:carboxyl-terminal processing protease